MEDKSAEQVRLLVVDDHKLVRAGLCRLLQDEADFRVVGEASDGATAIRMAEQLKPHVVLLDARLPGVSGVDACRAIRADQPAIKVLAVSSVASGVVPTQMIRAGASAYITKNVSAREMLKAVRLVADGKNYLSQDVATTMALNPFDTPQHSPFEKLSRREMQIADLLIQGKKVSDISAILELSPKTVYSYRYRIFDKLLIKSDVELTVLAVEFGLIEDDQAYSQLFPGLKQLAG